MNIIKRVLIYILIAILSVVFFVSAVILVDSFLHPDEIPSFFGWKPFIVVSESMEDTIMTNDLVIVKETPCDELKNQDIIAYKKDNVVILHRIVNIKEENNERVFVTKGDNNEYEDLKGVRESQVEGLYIRRIANLGSTLLFMQTPLGMVICVLLPVIIYLILEITDELRYRASKKKETTNKGKKKNEK